MDLASFLVRSFEPARLQGKSRDYRQTFRNAIQWMRRALRRVPTLDDLTPDNISKTLRMMATFRHSQSSINHTRKRLRTLALHAWRIGVIAEPQAAPLLQVKRPRRREAEPAPVGTLRAALAGVQGIGRKWRESMAAAVRYFDLFLERDGTLDDVATRFPDFVCDLATRRPPSVVTQYASALWALCRAVDPRRFPDRSGRGVRPATAEPGTLRHFYDAEYRPLKALGASDRHAGDYATMFNAWREHLGHDLRLSDLSDALAADHFAWLLQRGLLPITVNTKHRTPLFALWRFAEEQGHVKTRPKLGRLRVTSDEPDSFSNDELRRLIDATLKVRWRADLGGIPRGKYFRALLLFAYWTALRRSSLLKLKRADVDLITGWVTVPGNAMKGRRGKKLRLGADAIEAARAIWQPERELMFPCPCHRRGFYRSLNRIFAAAGLPPNGGRRMQKLHKIRRTSATLAAKECGIQAACDLLGHSSEYVTRRYVDPSKLPGSDATEFLPPIFADAPRPQQTAMQQAEACYAQRLLVPAAMLGRVALERWLVARCRDLKLNCSGHSGAASLGYALRKVEAIDEATFVALKRWTKTANRAAHGNDVEAERVRELLDGARSMGAE